MITQRALTPALRTAAAPSSSRSLATSSIGRQAILRAAGAARRPQPPSSPLFPRRNASSSSSSGSSAADASTAAAQKVTAGATGAAAAAAEKLNAGNDSIWAISSVLVFGALFVYLTSPTGKGHAKGHAPTPHKKDEDFPTNDEAFEGLQKTEDHRDSHLAGNKALAERAHAPDSEGAPTQKKTKDAPTPRHDNTTFQHGVAAAKDGDHVSDPKKVVAAAASAKQDKANKKTEKKETEQVEKEGEKNAQEGDNEEEKEGEKDE